MASKLWGKNKETKIKKKNHVKTVAVSLCEMKYGEGTTDHEVLEVLGYLNCL